MVLPQSLNLFNQLGFHIIFLIDCSLLIDLCEHFPRYRTVILCLKSLKVLLLKLRHTPILQLVLHLLPRCRNLINPSIKYPTNTFNDPPRIKLFLLYYI